MLLARAVFVALVATIGDFIWFEFGVRHTTPHGVMHGAALLLAVGLALAQPTGAWGRGAAGGILAGLVGALSFYAVADVLPFVGALMTAWVITWIVLAVVHAWLSHEIRRVARWMVPGFVAAVASGAAFYLVSGIWTDPAPGHTRNYLWHLVAWTLAWAPGMAALTWKAGRDRPI